MTGERMDAGMAAARMATLARFPPDRALDRMIARATGS
jgi:hypothetical protein